MFMYANSGQNKLNVYEKEKRILCQSNSHAHAAKT